MKHDLEVLSREFYSRPPVEVARELIGKTLLRRFGGRKLAGGTIVETEAYGGERDPASHAYRGKTARNAVMFGEAGRSYVYFTYGMHYCLNFATGKPTGEAAGAVLIRAIEPQLGVELMRKNRGRSDLYDLTNGPAKLCKALSIDLSLNGCDVTDGGSPLFVEDNGGRRAIEIASTPRVGIKLATERWWRFLARGSPYVSGATNVQSKINLPVLESSRFSRP